MLWLLAEDIVSRSHQGNKRGSFPMNCRLLFHMTHLLMLVSFNFHAKLNKYQKTGCPEKSVKADLSSTAEIS